MPTNSTGGSLYFDAGVNIEQLLRDFERARQAAGDFTQKAIQEGQKMDDTFSKLGRQMATFFSIAAGGALVKQIIDVRSEFQQLEISFETMLKSKEKADVLMKQVVEFAAITPFELTDLSGATKSLLAVGVAAEDVMGIMKSLGDISAGLNVPIQRLILNFGQVKNVGHLTGRDLRDFAMAGVPLLDELAKNYGKNTEEITAMVSAGKIGFKDVEKAFATMTAAGGRFDNLMIKQSKTLNGMISNLKDAWARMLNEIGEDNEGIVTDVIQKLQQMVANYDVYLEALKKIIVMYGAYRAAVALTYAVNSVGKVMAMVKAYNTYRASLTAAAAAQKAFNLATLATPIGLATAAISGLVYVLAKFVFQQGEAKKAVKKFTESMNEGQKAIDDEFFKLASLKKGTDEYKALKDEMSKKYSVYLKDQRDEIKNLDDMAGAQAEVNKQKREELALKGQADAINAVEDSFAAAVNKGEAKFKKVMLNRLGGQLAAQAWSEMQDLKEKIKKGGIDVNKEREAFLEKYNLLWDLGFVKVNKQKDAWDSVTDLLNTYADQSKETARVVEETQPFIDYESKKADELKKKATNEQKKAWADQKKIAQDELAALKKNSLTYYEDKTKIEEKIANLTAQMEGKPVVVSVQDEAYWGKIKEAIEADLKKLDQNNKKDVELRGILQTQLDKIEGKLEWYEKPEKRSKEEETAANKLYREKKKQFDLQQELSDMAQATELANAEAEVEAMKEGYARRLAAIDVEHQKETQKIVNARQDRIDAINEANKKLPDDAGYITELPPEEEIMFIEQATALAQKRNAAIVAEEEKSAEQIKKIRQELAEVWQTDLERELAQTKVMYAEMRKEATDALAGASKEAKPEAQKVVDSIDDAQKKAEAEINAKYRVKDLEAERELAIKKLELQRGGLDSEEVIAKKRLEIEKKTAEAILAIYKGLDPKLYANQIKELELAIAEADNQISKTRLKQGGQEYVQRQKNLKVLRDELKSLKQMREELKKAGASAKDIAKVDEAINDTKGSIKKFTDEDLKALAEGFGQFADILGQINPELENVSGLISGAARIAAGDIMGGLMQSIKSIDGLFKQQEKKREEEKAREAENTQNMLNVMGEAYERLGRTIDKALGVDRLKSYQSLLGSLAGNFNVTVGQLNKEIESHWANYIKLQKAQMKLLNREDLPEVLEPRTRYRDAIYGFTLDEMDRVIAANEQTMKYLYNHAATTDDEAFKLLVDAYEGYIEEIYALKKEIQEAFTQTTQEDIAQSIADGFLEGRNSMEQFTDDFEAMMKKAVLAGFKNNILNQAMDDFYEEFARLSGDKEGLTKAEIEELRKLYAQIIEDTNTTWQGIKELSGITEELDTEAAEEGLKGKIKGITEEQADLLGGILISMREYQIKVYKALMGVLSGGKVVVEAENEPPDAELKTYEQGIYDNVKLILNQMYIIRESIDAQVAELRACCDENKVDSLGATAENQMKMYEVMVQQLEALKNIGKTAEDGVEGERGRDRGSEGYRRPPSGNKEPPTTDERDRTRSEVPQLIDALESGKIKIDDPKLNPDELKPFADDIKAPMLKSATIQESALQAQQAADIELKSLLLSITDQQRLGFMAFNEMRSFDLTGIRAQLLSANDLNRLFYNEFLSIKQFSLPELINLNRQIAKNTEYNRILPEIRNELVLLNQYIKNV